MFAFVIVGVVVMQITANTLIPARIEEETADVDALAVRLAPVLLDHDIDSMQKVAESVPNARVLVLNPRGVVLVDSGNSLYGVRLQHAEVDQIVSRRSEREHGLARVQSAKKTRESRFSLNTITRPGEEWVGYYVASIVSQGNNIGMVFVSSSIQDVADRLWQVQSALLLYFIVVAVAVIPLGLLLAEIITRPINALNQVMVKTTRGDFTARARVNGHDEVAQLAETFNMMSEKLENIDKTRSEFISNASHELKTPLSGMQILVESMAEDPDMPEETRREFLADISGEIKRLTVIVSDLLTMVQMDSQNMRLKKRDIMLLNIVQETVYRLRPIARDRKISLTIGAEDPVLVHVDPDRMLQVAYNLVDNAIKYTHDGGSVTVDVRKSGQRALMVVTDTGVGIPKEEIGHLFERFYRVDKARSRGTGGSGLGLSIVRNILALHNGDISVESEAGKGSVFTASLPLSGV